MSQRIDDIRYSEFLFLNSFTAPHGVFARSFSSHPEAAAQVRLPQMQYIEMAATLLEEGYIKFENIADQVLVARVQGLARQEAAPYGIDQWAWDNPRYGLERWLMGGRSSHTLSITYRGLRRIEELRDVLRRERVLEDFGVLLSVRYLERDAEDAIRRPADIPVSVLYADMDGFKAINERFGHDAGNVVMKAYLEAVRDAVGLLGEAYRGVGDETTTIIVGQSHARAVEIAEDIRRRVSTLQCEYKGASLPRVTASIGVATSPPGARSRDLLSVAEQRERAAKEEGKDRVMSSQAAENWNAAYAVGWKWRREMRA